MKRFMIFSGLLALIGLSAFVAPMTKRKLVADKALSTVTYAAKHPLHDWEGISRDVNCAVMYNDDSKQIESVAVSIKVASFDSKNSNRDSHALEVLDGLKYPNVTFVSTELKPSEDGTLTARGNLTFHGVTRPVTFQATRKEENGRLTIEGGFPVTLSSHSIERPSLMGLKVDDQMTLRFSAVFKL
ncbi:YceI family protein [Fibrisoma montanum]|uniref:YceI family protein n=1 Tax=Fibrisoma montanum TaxID=2305895 RepID=A0A418M8V8_9BACT|nr:YceI family protein [Fibrisoma montanum]RIV22531.1 YceI family protein [Fibrisoma montanum]